MKFKSDIQAESKVGIGIATPIYDLDVSGVIRASKGFIDNTFTSDDTVRIVSPANATYTVAAAGETGAIKIVPPIAVYGGTTGTSTKVSFKVNISDGVVIQISGTFSRPGVGITDVWTALSVTTISNASTDNNYTITGDGSGSAAIWIGSSTDSQASLKGIWVTDCQVSGGIGGLSGGLPQAIAWDISINASVPTGFGTFLANNTQVTNWKRNGQKLYYGSGSGNVGIGTSSPSELLHLSSTGPARLLIQADTDNVTETDNAQIILKQDGGFVVGNLGYKTNTNGLEITNQYVGVDGILTFGTSNAERMRISDLGDVGIGTIGPNSKLEVAGEIDATTGDGYKINGKPWANQNANVLNLGDWDGEGFSTIIYDENSRGVVKIKDYGTMINCSSLSSSYGSRASLAVGTVGNENAGAAVITLSNNDTTSSAGDPTGAINFAIKADNGAGSLGYTSAIISGSIFFRHVCSYRRVYR